LSGVFEGIPRDEDIREQLKTEIEARGSEALHADLGQVDPEAASRILPGDAKRIIRALEVYRISGKPISSLQTQFASYRPGYDFTVVGLRHARPLLHERINARVDRMFEAGLAEEAIELIKHKALGHTASHAIGYREFLTALEEGRDPAGEEVRGEIKKNTRRLARKQMTWFRKFNEMNWLDIEENETIDSLYKRLTPFFRSCYDD
jgi:tRNA dimethylallyltransferase